MQHQDLNFLRGKHKTKVVLGAGNSLFFFTHQQNK